MQFFKTSLIWSLLLVSINMVAQNGQDLVVLGNQAMNEGRYRDAQINYEAAIIKDPQNAEIYTLLGFSLHKQKYFRKADSIYMISLNLDSLASRVYWYKGLNHIAMKQDTAAIDNYKRFITLEKPRGGRLTDAYLAIGRAYERIMKREGLLSWQIDDMIYYYELVEQTDPQFNETPLIQNFVALIKSKRPANQTGRWKLE
ncbi:MAG: hypothetical protein IT245_05320 [Bacteroidia bacterium]|nr:hypothetical protein [Bacteroidia bacterium]